MIDFGSLKFEITGDIIKIIQCGDFTNKAGTSFVEVQIAGENKPTHMGAKMVSSSEGAKLKYVSHTLSDKRLEVTQKSEKILVKTVFEQTNHASAFCAYTEVENISNEDIVLEDVSAIVIGGIGDGLESVDHLYFTRFVQSHQAECQPRRASFESLGMPACVQQPAAQRRIAFANVGSWSTKEALPQGIIEDESTSSFTMFQIESNASWYYEISDMAKQFYLYLGGANSTFCSWSKKLAPGARYRTPKVALAFGKSLNEVIGNMTKYRRSICGYCEADMTLPSIFNEYMHLSWDSPTEENTKKYAPVVAGTGVEYYVIDCGWHDEVPGDMIYPYVGAWNESHSRFPNGVRATTDYIRSLGMKAGLWIEPEIVGVKCTKMLDYYTDDCFITRHGKKVSVNDRYFLDYRHPKVKEYMTDTIRRMVEDYGADYIKFDYNQDMGVGTELSASSYGEGLELCAVAFLDWVDDMKRRFPSVIFEGCASGGMRMDYKTLSHFSIMSTSDQTSYLKYPYIAGNILSAVIPEQAAVWSYPVEQGVADGISDDRIIMNMVNSFLGRMHLASHLDHMNSHQLALVREGVEYYHSLSEFKRLALPYFPKGFTGFGANQVVAGLKSDGKLCIAVWCLGRSGKIDVPIDCDIKSARIAYPLCSDSLLTHTAHTLTVDFPRSGMAVFLEVICK